MFKERPYERNHQIHLKAIPSIIKIEISKIYSNMISKPLMNPIDISIGKLKVTDSHRKSWLRKRKWSLNDIGWWYAIVYRRKSFFLNLLRNISNTDLSSLATIFDIKLSNKKCRKWADGFLAQNGTYEEQKMIFQTTRSLTSAED